MWGQCIDLPPNSAPAAGRPTLADEQSISLRCQWATLDSCSFMGPTVFQAPWKCRWSWRHKRISEKRNMICWNDPLWLDVTNYLTIFSQSEGFVGLHDFKLFTKLSHYAKEIYNHFSNRNVQIIVTENDGEKIKRCRFSLSCQIHIFPF